MNYFKKNTLFLILASILTLCFTYNLSATKTVKNCVSDDSDDSSDQETIANKKKEIFSFVYNDPELFRDAWKPFNSAFNVDYTENEWLHDYKYVIKSLEKSDLKYFFHAIKNDKGEVVSFIFGKLCMGWQESVNKIFSCLGCDFHDEFEDEQESPKKGQISYVVTIPEYRGKGFARQLLMSVFDHYSNVGEIFGTALKPAVSFYEQLGGEVDKLRNLLFIFEFGRLTAFRISRSKAELERKKGAHQA